MALLADAIRTSPTETAEYLVPDGTRVVVQRIMGREEPDSEEAYAVCLLRDGQLTQVCYAAENLLEAMARMPSLGVMGQTRNPMHGNRQSVSHR